MDFVAGPGRVGQGKAGNRGAGEASDEDPSFELIGDEPARKVRPAPARTVKAGPTAQGKGRDGNGTALRLKRHMHSASQLAQKEDRLAMGGNHTCKAKRKHADVARKVRKRADSGVRQGDDGLDLDDLGLDVSAIQTGKRRRFAKCWDEAFDAGDEFDTEDELGGLDGDVAMAGTEALAGTLDAHPTAAAASSVRGRTGEEVRLGVLPGPLRLDGIEAHTHTHTHPHTHAASSRMGTALTWPSDKALHSAPEQRSAVVVHEHRDDDTSEDDFDANCGRHDAAAAEAWRQQRGVATLGTSLRRRIDLVDEMDLDDLGSDAEDPEDWGSDDSDGGPGALATSPQRRSRRVAAGSRMQAVLKAEQDEGDDDDDEEAEEEGGGPHRQDAVAMVHPRRKLVIKRARVAPAGQDSASTPDGMGHSSGLPVIRGDTDGEQPKKRIKLKVLRACTGQAGSDPVEASAPAVVPAARATPDADHVDAKRAATSAGRNDAVHKEDAAADTPTRLRGSGGVDNATSPAAAGSPAAEPASVDMVAANACEVTEELLPEERAALPLVLVALRSLLRSSLRYTVQDCPADVQDPVGLLDALEVCSAAHVHTAADWLTLVDRWCDVRAQVRPCWTAAKLVAPFVLCCV